MSELIYHVATSLDGFIAHSDGSFDGFEWDDEVVADFMADQAQFGTVLMGRKTYDVGLKAGKTSPYPAMRQVLFSRSMTHSLDPQVELVGGEITAFVSELKASTDRPIWLCGGGDIACQLFEAGLIDKVVIKLNPVIFGQGIPLTSALKSLIPLRLETLKAYSCGITLLRYRVKDAAK